MTPLIISSLLMVASAHEPSSTHFYSPLLAEVLSSVKPEEEVSEEKPLDPELGIGVEEITGACIAASWMGGENGWKIARVARWWAIGYLSNFDLPNPRSVTLGECLQILPTFRSIDQVDKMRIWLMAYCTEAQQAYMHDRPVLTPGVSPDPYIQALRAAFAEGRVIDSQTGLEHHNSPRGAGSSIGKVPEADRMLTAHAGLMFILTSARSRLREMRWRWGREREREREREIAGHHPLGVEELRATQIAEGDELRNAWKSWIAELDIFWIDAGVWEVSRCESEGVNASHLFLLTSFVYVFFSLFTGSICSYHISSRSLALQSSRQSSSRIFGFGFPRTESSTWKISFSSLESSSRWWRRSFSFG